MRSGAAVLGVLLLLLTSGLTAGSTALAGAPPPAAVSFLHPSPAAIHPATLNCAGFTPLFAPVAGAWPFDPLISDQPCAPVEMDEVHATLASRTVGSGERWTTSITLPSNSSRAAKAFSDVYAGMVVGGDSRSWGGLDYLKVSFSPNATQPTYAENISLLGLVNQTARGCVRGMNVSFAGALGSVEVNDRGCTTDAPLDAAIPAGATIELTFVGQVGSSSGLTVVSNDTADPSHSYTVTLNKASGLAYTFEPAYKTSCPDRCLLNWSMPFGLGYGLDLCPQEPNSPYYGETGLGPTRCNSYNQSAWDSAGPIAIGTPHFFQNGSYSGDFSFLSTESASGLCAATPPNSPPPGVYLALCYNFDAWSGTGFYPFFSFDGSSLYLGDSPASSLTTFGGAGGQFEVSGFPTDLGLLNILSVANDSRAGFVAPGAGLNVSAALLDVGNISNASVEYSIGGGAPASQPLAELSGGSPQYGTFWGVIPGTGGNGTIAFSVYERGASGQALRSPTYTAKRGPLPTFHVSLTMRPAVCTNVSWNGSAPLANGTSLATLPGYYGIASTSCYPYQFGAWNSTGPVRFANASLSSTTVAVGGNGTVFAGWMWVRPHVHVAVHTYPTSCGGVELNRSAYVNGGTASVLWGLEVTLTPILTGCSGYAFGGWTLSGNLTILGSHLTPGGNGSVTAHFLVPGPGTRVLTFATTPTGCGGVLFQGAGYTTNESLVVNETPLPIGPDPCVHWSFGHWVTSAGVSLANGSLPSTNVTVTENGTLTEVDTLQTWIAVEVPSGSCGEVRIDGTPFGNGSVLVVRNGSVHSESVQPCTGWHTVGVTVSGALALLNGNITATSAGGTIEAVFAPGPNIVVVSFLTDPGTCGGIEFNGTAFTNTQFTSALVGAVLPVAPAPCTGYGFVGWTITGAISIVGGEATVAGAGSIAADYAPLVTLLVYTAPVGCGSVVVGNATLVGPGSVVLTESVAYPVRALPCAGRTLGEWQVSAGANLTNGSLVVVGAAILTAYFVPEVYTLTTLVAPAACNAVLVQGASASNGSTVPLLAGNYSVGARPCAGEAFVGFAVGGAARLHGDLLLLSGNATLTATFAWLPPQVKLLVPAVGYAGAAVNLTATLAVWIASSGYRFSWAFGDGTPAIATTTNGTVHAFARPGSYSLAVAVTDPHGLTSNATATLVVLQDRPSVAVGISWLPASGAGGVTLLAVAVAWAVGRRRAPTGPPGAAVPPAGPERTEPVPSGPGAPPPA